MEVHHHPHTERKKWTHYFWEFLMLFLAVFLGFLAENQREHLIEYKRAKVYAQGLLKDLQNDIAEINEAMPRESVTSSMIDSLVVFMDQPNIYDKSGKLYYYMSRAHDFYGVEWSRATMNQLINSGNLRYFTNHELVNLISVYNTNINTIKVQEDGILMHRSRATSYRDRIFKAKIFLKSIQEFNQDSSRTKRGLLFLDSLHNADWPVISKEPELLNSYANALIATKSFRRRLRTVYYPQAITEATEIIDLLKKEYHLK